MQNNKIHADIAFVPEIPHLHGCFPLQQLEHVSGGDYRMPDHAACMNYSTLAAAPPPEELSDLGRSFGLPQLHEQQRRLMAQRAALPEPPMQLADGTNEGTVTAEMMLEQWRAARELVGQYESLVGMLYGRMLQLTSYTLEQQQTAVGLAGKMNELMMQVARQDDEIYGLQDALRTAAANGALQPSRAAAFSSSDGEAAEGPSEGRHQRGVFKLFRGSKS